jgi:hypothetical protein
VKVGSLQKRLNGKSQKPQLITTPINYYPCPFLLKLLIRLLYLPINVHFVAKIVTTFDMIRLKMAKNGKAKSS